MFEHNSTTTSALAASFMPPLAILPSCRLSRLQRKMPYSALDWACWMVLDWADWRVPHSARWKPLLPPTAAGPPGTSPGAWIQEAMSCTETSHGKQGGSHRCPSWQNRWPGS